MWNDHAVAKHCMKTGNQYYIAPAEDISQDGTKAITMKAKLATVELKDEKTGKLPASVQIVIGMQAMALLNIATEAEVANGTHREIQDIILDEREGTLVPNEDGAIMLSYPPSMLLFRPDKPTKLTFGGLPPGIIPLTPSIANFMVTGRMGKKYKLKGHQYAMTPGYAYTDYKLQSQTIKYVIIDIGKPPTRSLLLFSIYVALSRSRGRDTIRLLRNFDTSLFQNHPSENLRLEMQRLEQLNKTTI